MADREEGDRIMARLSPSLMSALPSAKHQLPITGELVAGWIERGLCMAAEARRTKCPRLRIMAHNHLRGLQQCIAEALAE